MSEDRNYDEWQVEFDATMKPTPVDSEQRLHSLEQRIGEMLGSDPVCMGRVSWSAVQAIAALTGTGEEPSVVWETFNDSSYYDMWCVREAGERRFGHSFHLVNGDEARGLVKLLNRLAMRAAGKGNSDV